MLSTILQTLVCLGLIFIGWWWLSLPWLLYLSWQRSVYVLIIVTIIWDAHSGRFFTVPIASLIGLLVSAFIIFIKPKFLLYNDQHEVV